MTATALHPGTIRSSGPASRTPRAADDPRWQAVLKRDPSADFVFAVRTTGIYCRPACPARRPLRANVRFYSTPADAERNGFRACRRCRPDRQDASTADPHCDAIAAACRRLAQAKDVPALASLAAAAGVSPSHFHRLFKARTGLTPRAFAAAQRRQRLHQAIGNGGSITQAIYAAGFSSSGRFYEAARDALGMTPTAFRAGGAGMTIRFAVGDCALGAICVAATDRGVCAIDLGDDPDVLLRGLQDRFPKAQFIGGDTTFERWVAQVIAFIEQPHLDLDLPLDIRGTTFQQRVWQALAAIPCGQTRTYSALARALGVPRATRAVARACAANRLAVAIPCHRVIRTDGSLCGYRWGLARKASLLQRERTGPAGHGR